MSNQGVVKGQTDYFCFFRVRDTTLSFQVRPDSSYNSTVMAQKIIGKSSDHITNQSHNEPVLVLLTHKLFFIHT